MPAADEPDLLAHRQEVDSDGRADDFLHVGSDDSELDHQPQDDARNLEVKK